MTIQQLEKNGTHIAWIPEKELLITDVQSALDLAATVKYETGCTSIILDKASICGDFFILSTGLPGKSSRNSQITVSAQPLSVITPATPASRSMILSMRAITAEVSSLCRPKKKPLKNSASKYFPGACFCSSGKPCQPSRCVSDCLSLFS